MSFFNWFSGRFAPDSAQRRAQAGRDMPDASLPQRLVPESAGGRLKRHARREQLYVAIREAMTRAGILSSSYKFKVLSLDQPGNEFLVMVDLVKPDGVSPGGLSGIEEFIVHNAKARFEITVPAVYWRLEERLADKFSLHSGTPAQMTMPHGDTAVAAARSALWRAQSGAARHEPIEADEVAAFKQALQAASSQGGSAALRAQGVKIHSGPRSSTLLTGFEETEMPVPDSSPVLSNTQYGDLN